MNKRLLNAFFLNDSSVPKNFSCRKIQAKDEPIELTVRVSVDLNRPESFPSGFIDEDKLNAVTEEQIRIQEQEDDEQAKLEIRNKNA